MRFCACVCLMFASKVFVFPHNHTKRQSRLDVGSSSLQDEAEDVEEQPLVRHSRHMSSASVGSDKETGEVEVTPPSSPGQQINISHPPNNRNEFHTDEVF